MTSPEHRPAPAAPAASWLEVSTENCSVQAALDVVGNKWALLVLRELFNGVRRFDEICVHAGISEAVLARRLKELIAAGVVEARPYREAGQRPRQEYVPTPAGSHARRRRTSCDAEPRRGSAGARPPVPGVRRATPGCDVRRLRRPGDVRRVDIRAARDVGFVTRIPAAVIRDLSPAIR